MEKGAAHLRKDEAVGKYEGRTDSAFRVGRDPVVWQFKRNRAGGQVLVCLFKLG